MSNRDVFICYSAEDRESAHHAVAEFERFGATVFWDVMLPPGADFATELPKLQRQARASVVLLSGADPSAYVKSEIYQAIQMNRTSGHRLYPLIVHGDGEAVFRSIGGLPAFQARKALTVNELSHAIAEIWADLSGQHEESNLTRRQLLPRYFIVMGAVAVVAVLYIFLVRSRKAADQSLVSPGPTMVGGDIGESRRLVGDADKVTTGVQPTELASSATIAAPPQVDPKQWQNLPHGVAADGLRGDSCGLTKGNVVLGDVDYPNSIVLSSKYEPQCNNREAFADIEAGREFCGFRSRVGEVGTPNKETTFSLADPVTLVRLAAVSTRLTGTAELLAAFPPRKSIRLISTREVNTRAVWAEAVLIWCP